MSDEAQEKPKRLPLFERIKNKVRESSARVDEKLKKKPEQVEAAVTEEEKPKEKGLMGKIDDIQEQLDSITQKKKKEEKFKKKSYKLPMGMKGKLKKLGPKNMVQVIYLRNNKTALPTIGEIKDGLLVVPGKKDINIHNGATDFVFYWNGRIPTMFVPEWDLNPISASKLYQDAVDNNRISEPQKIMIRAMEFKESMQKKSMSGMAWVWIIIGIIIVAYVLFAQQ